MEQYNVAPYMRQCWQFRQRGILAIFLFDFGYIEVTLAFVVLLCLAPIGAIVRATKSGPVAASGA